MFFIEGTERYCEIVVGVQKVFLHDVSKKSRLAHKAPILLALT